MGQEPSLPLPPPIPCKPGSLLAWEVAEEGLKAGSSGPAEGPEAALALAGCSPAPPCLLPWQAAQARAVRVGTHTGPSPVGTSEGGCEGSFKPGCGPNPLPWPLPGFCITEFDKFLEERAKAAEMVPSLPSPPGEAPAPASNPSGRKKPERSEDALFAL